MLLIAAIMFAWQHVTLLYYTVPLKLSPSASLNIWWKCLKVETVSTFSQLKEETVSTFSELKVETVSTFSVLKVETVSTFNRLKVETQE